MRNCLGIVPDMRTGTVAASEIITAAFIVPKPSVILPHNRGRFKDSQVSCNSLYNFRGERVIVKCFGECSRFLEKLVIPLFPVCCNFLYIPEPAAVPGFIISFIINRIILSISQIGRGITTTRSRVTVFVTRAVAADTDIRNRDIPGEHQPDGLFCTRSQRKWNIQRCTWSA